MLLFSTPSVLALHEWPTNLTIARGSCVYPGKCTPPATKYARVIEGPSPSQQWNINGGFCGAMSTQQAALAVGAYVSQDYVRKANKDSAGDPLPPPDTPVPIPQCRVAATR